MSVSGADVAALCADARGEAAITSRTISGRISVRIFMGTSVGKTHGEKSKVDGASTRGRRRRLRRLRFYPLTTPLVPRTSYLTQFAVGFLLYSSLSRPLDLMISSESLAFLKKLLDTPGPSGFEAAPAKVWREYARKFATVSGDVAGNSLAEVNGDGKPTIMLAGHIDEIGVIVNYVDDQGFAYIQPIGGWDPQVLIGQRLRFAGRKGDVFGVVGKKPIHLIKPEERKEAAKFTDIWVDLGAKTKQEGEQIVSVGDAGVIDSRTMEFPNGRIVSRSIDDRIGAFVILEALN